MDLPRAARIGPGPAGRSPRGAGLVRGRPRHPDPRPCREPLTPRRGARSVAGPGWSGVVQPDRAAGDPDRPIALAPDERHAGSGRGRGHRRSASRRRARRPVWHGSARSGRTVRQPTGSQRPVVRWSDVRRPRVVACMTLIVVLAWSPSRDRSVSERQVRSQPMRPTSSPGERRCVCPRVGDDRPARSGGPFRRDPGSRLDPPRAISANRAAPGSALTLPSPRPGRESVSKNPWRHRPRDLVVRARPDRHGTACGKTLTRTLLGVAHRSLPCGTLVTFRSHGVTLTVPVVDRGPYVSGRIFDLTVGACRILKHCYTGLDPVPDGPRPAESGRPKIERRAVHRPTGGAQSAGASSKPANANAGATMQPTSAHAPSGRAACQAPAGTTACGRVAGRRRHHPAGRS